MSGPKIFSYDSADKISLYILMIATEPIEEYNPPKHLGVSHTFWRDYTCPPICGGCCWNFTKDIFIEDYQSSNYPVEFAKREASILGKKLEVYSDFDPQQEKRNKREFCQFLNRTNGRCEIYPQHPFSCKFELNKMQFNKAHDRCLLSKKLYGRGWQYLRVDDGRGALCEMLPITAETVRIVINRDIPLIEKLCQIADFLGIKHRGYELLELLDLQSKQLLTGQNIKPVTLVGVSSNMTLF